jgi:type 1 glutamine amidotransferase
LIVVGENQGAWQPSNKLNIIEPGAFFGHRNNTELKNEQYPNGGVKGIYDRPAVTPPALHLPQSEIANSPSGSVVIPAGIFANQILLGDVKFGGLRRAWLEQVDGQYQGGAVQYSQGFECGINRLLWGPDGDLYVGGIGATETWGWTDPVTKTWTAFGLQKIHQKQFDTFEIAKVSATKSGFRVTFTRPVQAFSADKVTAKMWDYEPTPEYGGPKRHAEKPVLKKVKKVDESTFDLDISGLKEGKVVYLNFDVKSLGGSELWASECYYTLNRIPGMHVRKVQPPLRLLVFSKTAAFRHDSIPDGIAALKKMADDKGFQVTATEDADIFLSKELNNFDVVMFLSTTGDVLNDAQQKGFESFMKGGKGFVGIHAASDTEYDWPFYGELVGGYFKGHPAITQATINVEKETWETAVLPRPWQRVDEWYNFRKNPRSQVEVLASLDEKSYLGGDMGDHPIMWRTKVGKAKGWYTALGHTPSTYRESLFLESLYRGIQWAAGR